MLKKVISTFCFFFAFGSLVPSCKSTRSQSDVAGAIDGQDLSADSDIQTVLKLIQDFRNEEALSKGLPTEALREARKRLFGFVLKFEGRDKLEGFLVRFITFAKDVMKVELLQAKGAEDIRGMADQIADAIDSEVLKAAEKPRRYLTWEEISKSFLAQVRSTKFPPLGVNQPSRLGEDGFIQEMEKLIGTRFVPYEEAKVLKDGKLAFGLRDQLIESAQKSIWILTWAIYDDVTGRASVEQFLRKKAAGVDVRIIVDGLSSYRSPMQAMIDKLVAEGVPVIRWTHSRFPYHGMHRKLIVIDGKSAIIGGLNFGDEYSHKGFDNPQSKQYQKPMGLWRDTDSLVTGPAVAEASAIFTRVWNHYAQDKGGETIKAMLVPESRQLEKGKVAFVDHAPTEDREGHRKPGNDHDPIYLLTLKAIEGATSRIILSNAYYIATPAIQDALLAALKRGVKVQLHTNSAQSIDLPELVKPIMRGLPVLFEAGAEIYLQKKATLHSKFMSVDGKFSWIGSYNLHPRSHRYEGETVAAFLSEDFAKEVEKMFAEDMQTAGGPVSDPKQIDPGPSSLSDFAEILVFDQL